MAKITPQKARVSRQPPNTREAIREMKTYNGLFEKIVDEKNIQKAILRASLGKRKKSSVRRTLSHLTEVAHDLSEQLKNGTWRPLDIHQTTQINDGVELKKRYIVCPNFAREQCVHHAIMNICEPLFRKKFYKYSCGSVKGRGGDQAKKYIAKIDETKLLETHLKFIHDYIVIVGEDMISLNWPKYEPTRYFSNWVSGTDFSVWLNIYKNFN